MTAPCRCLLRGQQGSKADPAGKGPRIWGRGSRCSQVTDTLIAARQRTWRHDLVHAGHGRRPAGRGGIAVNGCRVGLEEPGRSSGLADQGAFAENARDSLLALRAASGHARRAALPRACGFWLAGVLFLLFFAAAAPSPLYGVYQAQWRFSAVTLTAVFAVYALLLLITLLVFGSVSDYLGRRRVILAGRAMAAGLWPHLARRAPSKAG